MSEVMTNEQAKEAKAAEIPTVAQAEAALKQAAASGNIEAILIAADGVKVAKIREDQAHRAKQRADYEAKTELRKTLTTELVDTIKPVLAPFFKRIVEVVGKDLATLQIVANPVDGVISDCKVVKVEPRPATASKVGSGKSGKTSKEYGLTLDEAFHKFATDADRAKYDALGGSNLNSKQWKVKDDVKKRAIADGLLAPLS